MNKVFIKDKFLRIKHALFKLRRKFIIGPAFTSKDPEYKKYPIGEYTYGFPEIITFRLNDKVEIGKFCSIAKGVKIFLGGNHKIYAPTTSPLPDILGGTVEKSNSKGDIIIGNDVWIGYEAVILSGVKIGDGAIIGARAVVTKDVEPYSIIVGNPGREVKKRFDDKTIKKLLQIKWWDWPIEKIKENSSFLQGDIGEFIKKFGS
jgi:acetyltransferase-like isoleucine patch superfamily enzyme